MLTVARIADAFHVLPSVAARALDEDPEQLDIVCLGLLAYASVKEQFDRAGTDDKAIEHLRNHPLMLQVRRNAFDLHLERVEARKRVREQDQEPPRQRRGEQAQEPDGEVRLRPLRREKTNGR